MKQIFWREAVYTYADDGFAAQPIIIAQISGQQIPHPLLGREWTLPPVPAGNRPTGVAPDQPAPAGGAPGAPAPGGRRAGNGNGVGDALEALQVQEAIFFTGAGRQAPRSSKPERAMQQIHHHLGASDRKGVREATFFLMNTSYSYSLLGRLQFNRHWWLFCRGCAQSRTCLR